MQSKESLQAFVRTVEELEKTSADGVDGFAREFAKLKQQSMQYKLDKTYSTTHGEKECNRRKNRYKDILPFDYTRVQLSEVKGSPGSDYINANFLKGATGERTYIASQAPLPATVVDFWRMLWEYNVKVVIMACREVEQGKHKCERYWANRGEEKTFGDITVSMEDQNKITEDFLRRIIVAKKGSETRQLVQFHYTTWPDHGVPLSPRSIIDLIGQFRQVQPMDDSPICVHCSAGCGRTGTICAIDYTWSLIKKGQFKDLSMYELVTDMRRQRPAIVQTKEQYELVNRAVLELVEDSLKRMHNYENFPFNNGQASLTSDYEVVALLDEDSYPEEPPPKPTRRRPEVPARPPLHPPKPQSPAYVNSPQPPNLLDTDYANVDHTAPRKPVLKAKPPILTKPNTSAPGAAYENVVLPAKSPSSGATQYENVNLADPSSNSSGNSGIASRSDESTQPQTAPRRPVVPAKPASEASADNPYEDIDYTKGDPSEKEGARETDEDEKSRGKQHPHLPRFAHLEKIRLQQQLQSFQAEGDAKAEDDAKVEEDEKHSKLPFKRLNFPFGRNKKEEGSSSESSKPTGGVSVFPSTAASGSSTNSNSSNTVAPPRVGRKGLPVGGISVLPTGSALKPKDSPPTRPKHGKSPTDGLAAVMKGVFLPHTKATETITDPDAKQDDSLEHPQKPAVPVDRRPMLPPPRPNPPRTVADTDLYSEVKDVDLYADVKDTHDLNRSSSQSNDLAEYTTPYDLQSGAASTDTTGDGPQVYSEVKPKNRQVNGSGNFGDYTEVNMEDEVFANSPRGRMEIKNTFEDDGTYATVDVRQFRASHSQRSSTCSLGGDDDMGSDDDSAPPLPTRTKESYEYGEEDMDRISTHSSDKSDSLPRDTATPASSARKMKMKNFLHKGKNILKINQSAGLTEQEKKELQDCSEAQFRPYQPTYTGQSAIHNNQEIGFGKRVAKPKGPRDPPKNWFRKAKGKDTLSA
ncbi:tyrosine-protein phosphatase non-receptor type 12-like [Branchiostoma floridae]|uniref:protein-tyrosine-phosphatase n=1 Tax=Branchiostoma floridae TaxID=7739 RepID=A0A9J7L744_BRAFL|nr:tyrosine-protein phosphatase non-receptor type 12-like [Branchiostoma floridae]